MNKKGYAGLIAVIIIIILICLIWSLVVFNSRECNSNKDCDDESYCGSDFNCHKIPVIEKTVVKRSFTGPTLIIAITLIILAVIFRWEKMFGKREPKTEKPQNNNADTSEKAKESYYTSQFQYTAK